MNASPLYASLLFLVATCLVQVASNEIINVVVVCCGAARLSEALTCIRSILLLTESRLSFHIFHQESDGNDVLFSQVLSSWQRDKSFSFQFYAEEQPTSYQNLFAPCACQRLFLHNVLTAAKVVYLDSDTIVLQDINDLWSNFKNFSQNSIMAAAAEHEASHQHGHYKDQVQHPYYKEQGVHGLNSGVLLIDLDKLRQNPWENHFDRYREQYNLLYHDQDLINIYFAQHPDELLLLSCKWNYRSDHCYFGGDHCSEISLLHGNRGIFHKDPTQPFSVQGFRFLYEALQLPLFELGSCQQVYQRLVNAVVEWMNQLDGRGVSNLCESSALPLAIQRLQNSCVKVNEFQQRRRREQQSKHQQQDEL